MEPSWPLEHGYHIEIQSEPTIRTQVEVSQPSLSGRSKEERLMGLGMVATAMPLVNAIPAICEAEPGVRTYGVRTYIDLPLICSAHLLYTG